MSVTGYVHVRVRNAVGNTCCLSFAVLNQSTSQSFQTQYDEPLT